ncbi:uncharacterized protein LOC143347205 [Colletes latitarsis]|uniref:uncharacterized protein LOC143347205 n=1 Tax=Colletes latitarsis TaxID=2605962 RepID=UPI004036D98E
MKERDGCQSIDSSKKHKGRSKKYKSPPRSFDPNCWPKVIISRDNRICKIADESSGTSSTFLEAQSSKLQAKTEKEEAGCDVQHLCCEESYANFEEEQSVCLISSSSEIQEDSETCETTTKNEKDSKNVDEPVLDCSISETIDQDRPIFVDLTADEKNTWKQTILKRFSDVNTLTRANQEETGNEKCSGVVALESRIMIADSSSKVNYKGPASLATALRDRRPCFIPVQPNHSLPIRPAPPAPTRSFRVDCSSLLVVSKPINLDVVEVEPVKSISISNEEVLKNADINLDEQDSIKESASSLSYVIPQISSVESLRGPKRKFNDNVEHENTKKKRSQEADSSQNREECVESSIKEFLKNFCGSKETGGPQNLCGDKCAKMVSTTKEDNGSKVVPPLRLKKVLRTEADKYSNSQITTGSEQETNYRIITGSTPRPQSNPVPSTWSEMLCEKETNPASLKTDSYKLKYRRNRLKQKLRELRNKAQELAKQMANDTSYQQNTRLRQVMNRYEKQIENLSKLHSKLSIAIPASSEVINVNDNGACPTDDKYLFVNLNEEREEPLKNNFLDSSPEPPKLSPRSPLNYETVQLGEISNSPPILPRVCLPDSIDEDLDLQVSETKIWPIIGDSMEPTVSTIQCNSMEEAPADLKECVQTRQQNSTNNVHVEDFDNGSLNRTEKVIRFFEDDRMSVEKKEEGNKLVDEIPDPPMVQKSEKIKCLGFSDQITGISSVASGLQAAASVSASNMFESTPAEQLTSSRERVPQHNSYVSSRSNVMFTKVSETGQNMQKVTSSSNQLIQTDSIGTSKQEHVTSQQNCKGEKLSNDLAQRSGSSNSITEQFPTLGNWVARMSKKQTLKPKSKLQTMGNDSFASTENASRIPGPEMQKISGPSATDNILNNTPQCNTDRWQYYQPQQRRQQLLQHVAGSVTLSQPVPSVPPLRPNIYSPLPMNQFYPNNYAIDPYNGVALSYHPAMYPYGTYPYHSRLHPSFLPGYNFPMQEGLRPLQHADKRFPPMQEPMIKYPSPTTSNLQHPNNLSFDRLRGRSTNNANTGYLPPLFLPSPSLPASQQTLLRVPLSGHSMNSQYSQNRMIPDVVAAAAAAAVVAAASFDRQRDTITSNRANNDALQTSGLTNVIESPLVANDNKPVINRDATNHTQDVSLSEEGQENNVKYQQMQNFLFDRLSLVKAADNFAQTNPVVANEAQVMPSIDSTTPYRVALVPSHAQLSKTTPGNPLRNCKTPHLGKVNRSPNSLHNLSCSNCGVIGPKFKCLGCEMIFYCDERCQEKHWGVHMQWCPKKMPKLKKVT